MIARASRRNTLALTGILGLVVATIACSGAEAPANGHPDESSATSPGTSQSSNGTQGPEQPAQLVAGGMDSGGSVMGPPSWNESPDGKVTTTLGDYVESVRSTSLIAHWFEEAGPGAAEYMHIVFQLRAADGRKVSFDFEYTGVQRTFSLRDNGQFSIVKNGEILYGRAGTVTIEPVGTDALRVSFEQIAVGPIDEAGQIDEAADAELIGNGVVEGPLRRVCTRAADVVYANSAGMKPTPAPLHDEAWINQFCGTTD